MVLLSGSVDRELRACRAYAMMPSSPAVARHIIMANSAGPSITVRPACQTFR